jgi:hypothetical protein
MPRYGRDPEAVLLGGAFRAARERCGRRASEVAALLGVGRTTVIRWETGRRKIDRGSWRAGEGIFAPHLAAMDDVCPAAVVRGGLVRTDGKRVTAMQCDKPNEGVSNGRSS